MAKLKIKRPTGLFSRESWRAYRIIIDGKEVGTIHRGKELEFDLPAGEHQVQVKIDWCGSHVLTVMLADPHEKVLVCKSSGNGGAALFSPDDYLILQEEESEQHKKSRHKQSAWATCKSLFKYYPLTMGLIMLLSAIFTLEMCLNVGPYQSLSPSLATLVAFGGLYHPAVLQQGEWFRLFSPVLLHASIMHLLLNCYALLLAGMLLENMIGRPWYLAVFLVGGVGGSLMSLAINPENLISVGASGAIMALFGAALATSFHLPADANRKGFQLSLVQILVFSMVPFLGGAHGQHIDIAAHLGGVITGGLLGGFIVLTWKQKGRPRFRQLALGLCLVSGMGYVYATVPVVQNYQSYALSAKLMPNDEAPKSDDDAKSRAKDLLAKYPEDPRSYLYMAMAYIGSNDMASAEKELRLGLDKKEVLKTQFAPSFERHLEGVLGLVLKQEGQDQAAKAYAAPLCHDPGDDVFAKTLDSQGLCR